MSWSAPSSDAVRAAPAEVQLSAAELEERFEELIGSVLSSRRTAVGIAQALAAQPRATQDFALQWAAVTTKSSPELAYQFAALAAHAVGELGFGGAQRWLLAAMDVYDREGLYRASAELKDLPAFAARNRKSPHGVAFEDVCGVLTSFLAGLAGRMLRLEAGGSMWTDSAAVYLPARVAVLPTYEENFRVYKVSAVLLWAQARFGTFNLSPEAYPRSAPALARFNVLEALRLEARLQRLLPGLHRDLQALAVPPLDIAWTAARARVQGPEASAADSALLAASLPDSLPMPSWPFLGVLDLEAALAVRAERLAREQRALRTALAGLQRELSGEQTARTRPLPTLRLLPRTVDTEDDASAVAVEVDGRTLTPPPELASLAQSVLQDLGALPPQLLQPAGEAQYDGAAEGEAASEARESGDVGSRYYDEWDYRRKHYRKDWCVLHERDVHPGDAGFVAAARVRYRPQIWQLKRSFEALRGEDKRLRGEPYGDDIDLDAVVRAQAALASGEELEERIFARRARHERDMAVLFMVDMSGSTKGWINDCEREALVLLCEALEVLGDRYAIFGFSGMTRKRCEVYRVKRFAEPYDELVAQRIAGILPLDYTRMGVAIRHLSGILAAEEARTRLLVTLSDGKPDDFSDGYRGEYGIEDTRQALIEAKRVGIHPFCITIDREAREYLPRMYGAVNYTVVSDVARLPLKVAEVYRRLTA